MRIAAAILSLALVVPVAADAGKKKKVKRVKPTCEQVTAAVQQTATKLRPVYGAAQGGADNVCITISKFTKQGAGTIGRRDPSPTCMVIACCPATDCIHTNWTWDQLLTRNKKGKLVTEISPVRCRRFQVLNGAPGGPTTTC